MLFIVGGIYFGMFAVIFLFGIWWKYRYRILRGRLRIRVLGETGKERSFVVKTAAKDGETITRKIWGVERSFIVMRAAIIFTGAEEMPTLEYNAGDAAPTTEPLSPMNRAAVERQVSSIRFREVAENTIMRDVFESFRKKVIDNFTQLIIIVAVVLLCTAILGFFLNDKLGKIEERLPSSNVEVIAP